MRGSKIRITQLKNRVKEILPNEQDILGFEGVSKEIILQSLEETYSTLELQTSFEAALEGVMLQRTLADLTNRANHYLKDKFKHQEPKDFNEFLYAITDIHFKTKEAYISLTKEPVRLDISMSRAKEMYEQLHSQNLDIQPLLDKLTELYNSASTSAAGLSKLNSESAQKLTEISSLLQGSQSQKKKIDQAVNNITKTEEKMEQIKTEAAQTLLHTTALSAQAEKLHETLKADREAFEKELNALQASIIKNDSHQQLIQETIENANRVGMAASFKKRKDELTWPYWGWAVATVLTIIGLILSSIYILDLFRGGVYNWEFLFIRIPVLGAFVWLGWFCAKQFGFVSRIREDYSYKFAVSMAFEGYKNATKEVDEAMLGNLLALTLENISTSPLNIYESANNHGTPFNEILSGWKRSKARNKNSTTNNTNTKTIEAEENEEVEEEN